MRRLTGALMGRAPTRPTYAFSNWLFLRLLGIVYLCAFWSLGVQVRGLIGERGILPARSFMATAAQWADGQGLGLSRFWELPTLCWFGTSDQSLQMLCTAGVALALLLVSGVASALVLPLLWVLYLSLAVVGRDFLSFQWDTLLLETGFLAILIAPLTLVERPGADEPRAGARWLVWWLLFRLMLGSGITKLSSGDPTWWSLTSLTFHYETQPLPTPLAWYAHQLPVWFHKGSTAAVLGIELLIPWFMLGSCRLRRSACGAFVLLQALIALTGNYAFFNFLTVALSLTLLDDAMFRSLWRPRDRADASRRRWPSWVVAMVAVVVVGASWSTLMTQARLQIPGATLVAPLRHAVAPFRSVNAYGLFAVMTTSRPEIIVEGSDDGATWRAYAFKYKPGDLARRPVWVAPHQPRLDWQMWFAALNDARGEPWFHSFCERLLEGSPAVLDLMASNPFPERPPRFVRGTLYEYRFTNYTVRRSDGTWWAREFVGQYSEPAEAP